MDKIILEDIMKKLNELQSEISSIKNNLSSEKLEMQNTPMPQAKLRTESFMEFFNKFNPKNEVDKTLVVMHFLELNRHKQNITTKDIAEGFKEVREKVPINVADKIQWLHKKGRVMPGEAVDNLKGWLITRSGLDYLKELKDEIKKK